MQTSHVSSHLADTFEVNSATNAWSSSEKQMVPRESKEVKGEVQWNSVFLPEKYEKRDNYKTKQCHLQNLRRQQFGNWADATLIAITFARLHWEQM